MLLVVSARGQDPFGGGDDDVLTLEALDSCLRSEGFETELAKDGEEALSVWKERKVDLVCLDIMMPKVDGFEVCRQIRKSEEEVPVIFLSAKNEEVDVVVGLELGADDFVRKPFGKHELLARIRSVLRRTGGKKREREYFLIRGELRVFPKELRAEREDGSGDILLAPREVAILQLLSDRKGEAVSRDVLLDECWGVSYFPESRSLDQYIAQLRKKIEVKLAEPRLIETVRGVEYRIPG